MSSTPKQPRKKRRIDNEDEPRIGPEVLPLVHPNQVPKSSKDPHRGLYPRTEKLNKRTQESSPSSSSIEQPKILSTEENKDLASIKNEEFFQKFKKCYGLFGDIDFNENLPNYFECLPAHVLELILCQIPFVDLMNYRLVCSQWNEVINDDKFMEWKKIYYQLKKGKPEASAYIKYILGTYKYSKAEECFPVLMKYMSEGFCRKPSYDMYSLLCRSKKGLEAELLLKERWPELLNKESKSWCLLATALIISVTVEEISEIYESLQRFNNACSLPDVTDAMYCVAAFCYYYKSFHGLNHGYHYRIYNALYWIENTLPDYSQDGAQKLQYAKGLPGQQNIRSYCDISKSVLTYEQLRILNHCFQPKQILKIVALAGTGKTTTLIHLSQMYPQVKFLNVMYNKAVCEEAKQRFPSNVTCRTAHSLAFAVHGNRLKHKLTSKVRPHDIVSLLNHHSGTQIQIHSYAKYVIITINSYVNSADTTIDMEHVPILANDEKNKTLSTNDRTKICKDAQQVWSKMIDPENRNTKITHDVYLKMYQLSRPQLSQYNCLMVDEAQDCNPAMLDIMMSQNLPVILVGDPNQQIYGFRGAKNALQNVDATHTYYLTKSFRFGPEISYVASICLELLKRNHGETIVGSNKPSSIEGKLEGQYAIIARTNVGLFNEAIRLCCHKAFKNYEPTNIFGCFAGGFRNYGFDQLLDICKLAGCKDGSPVPVLVDRFIARFKTYKDLCGYVRCVEDSDLQSKIDLVNQHGQRIPEYLKAIKEKCNHTMAMANVVFSTAHRAKGLEFDTVSITEDYKFDVGYFDYYQRRFEVRLNNSAGLIDSEESNVLYVAITRAKKSLLLPDKLLNLLLVAQEKFEFPVLTSTLVKDVEKLKCINCNDEFKPHTVLTLHRRNIVGANGRVVKGGSLCLRCATEPTVRPRLSMEPVVMYLDPVPDVAHQAMAPLVGPLPSDPPIERGENFFHEMDLVYVINFNM